MHVCRLRKRKRPHVDPCLKFDGQVIEMVDTMNILGVIFDKKLNWGPHIENIRRRAKARLNILKVLTCDKYGADEKIMLQLLDSLVLSTLEYGVEVYASASQSVLKRLETVYNEGIRIATGLSERVRLMVCTCWTERYVSRIDVD